MIEAEDSKPKPVTSGSSKAIFDKDWKKVYIKAAKDSSDPLELLLIGGVPLREPIARYGPFVMNTQQEINQAIEEYRSGRLGKQSLFIFSSEAK